MIDAAANPETAPKPLIYVIGRRLRLKIAGNKR
jgi:hypothetical protein